MRGDGLSGVLLRRLGILLGDLLGLLIVEEHLLDGIVLSPDDVADLANLIFLASGVGAFLVLQVGVVELFRKVSGLEVPLSVLQIFITYEAIFSDGNPHTENLSYRKLSPPEPQELLLL